LKKTGTYLLLIIILFSCHNDKKTADLVITNATIWTGNEAKPHAQSMGIAD